MLEKVQAVLAVLIQWQYVDGFNIDTSALLDFILDQIVVIIFEVRNKLLYKAAEKFDLLDSKLNPNDTIDAENQAL